MRILVTGGAGFIGTYLVKFLNESGNSITIFDDFSNSNKHSIQNFEELGIKIIEGDIRDFKKISNAVKDHDIVIHLAAKISVVDSIKNPSKTFSVNVEGTKNVLLSCKKNNIKKIIVSSSAAVYGEGKKNFFINEKTKTNPISPYGESKTIMEQEIINFANKNKINFIILRFFNVYGNGQTKEYAGVITKFSEKIKKNKTIEIFGDGNQIRDFISISDIITSISKAIEYSKNGIFNIASGIPTNINELADLMLKISNKRLNIKYLPQKSGDIEFSLADISLAKEQLQFFPTVSLHDGITEILDFRNKS